MSTKSKNPLFKRINVEITQEIIDKAKPYDPQGCYFYLALHPLLNVVDTSRGASFGARVSEYRIFNRLYPFTKKVAKYINDGCYGKKMKPANFDVWIPRKYLK